MLPGELSPKERRLTFIGAAAEEKSKTYSFGNITGIDASFTYEIHVTSGPSDDAE